MKAEEWYELSEKAELTSKMLRESGGLADTVRKAEAIRETCERQGSAALWEEYKREKKRPSEEPVGVSPKSARKKVTKEDAQSAILEAERLVARYQYDHVLTSDHDKDASTALNILTDARITLAEGRDHR